MNIPIDPEYKCCVPDNSDVEPPSSKGGVISTMIPTNFGLVMVMLFNAL
jgi:hypothetical protein